MDARDKRGHDGREGSAFQLSWPGLNAFVMAGRSRPSRLLLLQRCYQLDRRHKAGHDGREAVCFNSSWPELDRKSGSPDLRHVIMRKSGKLNFSGDPRLVDLTMSGGFVYIMTNRCVWHALRRRYQRLSGAAMNIATGSIRGFTKQQPPEATRRIPKQHDDTAADPA